MLNEIIAAVSDALYSYILIILLVASGLYFTVRTRFAPFRLFKEQLRVLKDYEKQRKEGKEHIFHASDIDLPDKVDYWN